MVRRHKLQAVRATPAAKVVAARTIKLGTVVAIVMTIATMKTPRLSNSHAQMLCLEKVVSDSRQRSLLAAKDHFAPEQH